MAETDDSGAPPFTAVASSPRQLHHLLNTISFATRASVRITPEGIRFSASEPGVLEASIFLPAPLFLTYRLHPPSLSFSLPLAPLLSTLHLLSSTAAPDVPANDTGAYAPLAHRLARHAFSAQVLGTAGQCRLVYRAASARLELAVPETGGVRTACRLATYLDDDDAADGVVPFDRAAVRLKAILPASVLGDVVGEVGFGGAEALVVEAGGKGVSWMVLRGEGGGGGECRVDFREESGGGRTRLLETFVCEGGGVRWRYGFGTVRKALVAMRAGTKVSLRIDGQGVLSLQFLVEVAEEKAAEEVAFVDFRMVPLFGDEDGDGEKDSGGHEEDD